MLLRKAPPILQEGGDSPHTKDDVSTEVWGWRELSQGEMYIKFGRMRTLGDTDRGPCRVRVLRWGEIFGEGMGESEKSED